MTPSHLPIQRPRQAKLLVVDEHGHFQHCLRAGLADSFRCGDLVIANDAATLPASLAGEHLRTGRAVEVRLAGFRSLGAEGIRHSIAVVFGTGDFRTRTEDRPLPPELMAGDQILLGPLRATVEGTLLHPRLVRLVFDGPPNKIWEGLARHGRPIQYAHVRTPLNLWDVWTPIAGPPAAFEPPSAGFALDWNMVGALKERGVQFATITQAAGISSTGDPALDAFLPLDEPYRISSFTALAIREAQTRGGRVIAIGTTVVRTLEEAASVDGLVHPGEGVAKGRIGPSSRLRVVNTIVSGVHEPGSSHHELLRAFVDDETLSRIDRELNLRAYRTHEFGDSVLLNHMDHQDECRTTMTSPAVLFASNEHLDRAR